MGTLKYRTWQNANQVTHASGVTWVPVRTAASILEVTRQRVYQLCAEGKLTAQSFDGTTLISMRSIEGRKALLGREGG